MSKAGNDIANEAWGALRERIEAERAEAAAAEREACAKIADEAPLPFGDAIARKIAAAIRARSNPPT